jgi:hypothetical protein
MTFSISALVLARDSHIKPGSEDGGLIWVEGLYQGQINVSITWGEMSVFITYLYIEGTFIPV